MPRYKVFAAIDLGSTEITMKIAEVSKKNGISVLDTVKYDLSIGKESYAVGKKKKHKKKNKNKTTKKKKKTKMQRLP